MAANEIDILQKLRDSGFTPEENIDGFEPINGKYMVRIDRAGRVQGTSNRTGDEYDFFSINVQVVEVIDGDKAMNRFLRLTYNPDEDGMKKLLNDLFTAGIECKAQSLVDMDADLQVLTDKVMNLRAWVWTPEKDRQGNTIPEDDRKPYQQLKIVKGFKGKKDTGVGGAVKSSVPF